MSSPLPVPSSDDIDMNGTPVRKSLLPRGSSPVTPIQPRQDDLSRPGTVARRALAVPSSSRDSANGGTGLSLSSRKLMLTVGRSVPSSSASRRTPVRQMGPTDSSDNGLFFPASPISFTPRANRRGDVHPSAVHSTPTRRQYAPRTTAPPSQANVPSSARRHDLRDPGSFLSSMPIDFPSTVAGPQAVPTPSLSARAIKSEAEDLTRVIWGTNVSLSESMKSFTNFMRNFKIKYRVSWDRDRGLSVPALSSPEEGERLLYEDYLRTMRVTNQTNLNLDMLNLQAFPPTKKLYTQLIKYPQEIIPVMDQVLKDLMVAVAEVDQQNGVEGMQGDEGEDEINEIMSKVYKVRPWGGDACNMRDLNPTGDAVSPLFTVMNTHSNYRYRQTRHNQRSRYPCNPNYPGHEDGLLSLFKLFTYCSGRDRPWPY